ncbi:MAG: RDD family protein [Planctomycetota bacterium]|jgi:uncharacterized RDD family membrane protein YckC
MTPEPGESRDRQHSDLAFSGRGAVTRTVRVRRQRLPLAGRGARLAAALLDGALKVLCFIPLFAGLTSATSEDAVEGASRPMISLGISFGFSGLLLVVLWVYQAYLRAVQGQTIGKKLLKVRIVNSPDGGNPGFARAVLMRDVVPWMIDWFASGLFFMIDACFIFGAERRCIHDLMAGTQVVEADAVPGVDPSVFD